MSELQKPVPNIPILAGESDRPIRLNCNNFVKMFGSQVVPNLHASENLDAQIAMAPDTHRAFDRAQHIKTESQAKLEREMILAQRHTTSSSSRRSSQVRRGDMFRDTNTGRRITVIRASVDRSKRGTPIHEVVDKSGNCYRIKESKLTPIR